MKRFFRYLYDCRYIWIWAGFSSVIFVSVFALYGIRMEAAWYPVLLSALFGIIMVVCGYIRHEKKHRGLKRIRLSGRSSRIFRTCCLRQAALRRKIIRRFL